MSSPPNSVTRMTQTLRAVTSHIFRCHGLQQIPSDADRLGIHDLAWWLVFIGAISGWFLFIFSPQNERLSMLKDRFTVLQSQLKENKKELQRLQRGIKDLAGGDANAWERAARDRLGWLEPGELTDVVAWNQMRVSLERIRRDAAPRSNSVPSVLPHPRIPALPVPPPSQGAPRLTVATDADKMGPIFGSPPPPPPIKPQTVRVANSTQLKHPPVQVAAAMVQTQRRNPSQ